MDFNTFYELSRKHLLLNTLADISREIGVTPQVVSNWKSRGVVPNKHVKILTDKINSINNDSLKSDSLKISPVISEIFKEESLDYLKYFNISYKYIFKIKFFIMKVCFVMSLIGFLFVGLSYDYVYSSRTKFLPLSSAPKSGGMGGMVSALGLKVGTNQANLASSSIIPEVIKSRKLASKISSLNFKISKDSSSLAEKTYYKKLSIGSFLRNIKLIKSRQSPIITLDFKSKDPYLSKIVLDSLLSVLDDMVSKVKLSMILDKKSFVQNRIDETFLALASKEEDVKSFNEKNRSIFGSPKLMLENARLAREVEVLTQVYISLKTQMEMISIDQSSNEKSFQILDKPEIFSLPINQKKYVIIILFFISGIPISVGLVFSYNWLLQNRKKLFN